MAQSRRAYWPGVLASGLALACAGSARADYVGDLFVNSGASVWSAPESHARLANPAGASILNQSQATGEIVDNGGVIRNAPAATWTGDVDLAANRPGAAIVNEGQWNGTLRNAGGDIENAGKAASVDNASGRFVNDGALSGDLVNAGQATNNGALAGGVVNASVFVNNAAGSVAGRLTDSGSTTNNGVLASVVETGAFVNNAGGKVTGAFTLNGGEAVNNGLLSGGATVTAGSLVVNAAGVVQGDVANAGALTNAGTIKGGVNNAGAFTLNGGGGVAGAFVNQGQATINGDLAGGATNQGRMTINAAGHVEGGLVVENGLVANAGAISGGAVVRGGTLTSSGTLSGGLDDAGLVEATGSISGPIRVTGRLVVGDAPGATLTLAPGSTLAGAVAVPVDLATGKGAFLSTKGADVSAARLDLAGSLVNPKGAYWGSFALSDAPLALTPTARAQLAAASGPLYAYADSGQGGVTQTINPGLGATASQIAAAAELAFTQALGPPPDAGPDGFSLWARGVATSLTVSGDNIAGTGPAFDATRFATRLAGAEAGLDYRISSLRIGLTGGELAGRVADPAGAGDLRLPFLGGYATLNAGGFSAEAAARYLALDMRLTDAALAVSNQSQRAAGMSYVAQTSYRARFGAFYAQPETGVSYTRLSLADETTNVGALSFGRAQLALAHAGLRLGAEVAAGDWSLQPYALAAVWRAWRSGTIVVPQGPTITPSGLAGFEQVGLGLEALGPHGLSLGAQGEGLIGPKVSGLSGKTALRWRF